MLKKVLGHFATKYSNARKLGFDGVSAISSKKKERTVTTFSWFQSVFLTLVLHFFSAFYSKEKHYSTARSFPSLYPGLAGLTFVSSTVSYHAIILTYNSHTL